jgi:hypothetical protein
LLKLRFERLGFAKGYWSQGRKLLQSSGYSNVGDIQAKAELGKTGEAQMCSLEQHCELDMGLKLAVLATWDIRSEKSRMSKTPLSE